MQRSRLPDNENSSRRVRWRKAKTREATKTIHRQHQTVDTINDITVRMGCRSSQPLETTRQSSDGGRRSHMICRKEEEKHNTEITSKSSKALGMVKRILGPCKPEVKDTAYNMLVRPKLEYASPIWNPHASSQIIHLERIQHYAARFVANDHRRTTRQLP